MSFIYRQRDLFLPLEPMGLTRPGKLSVIIDGQFGSTGKGLAASYVGMSEHVDISIAIASPQAGHTWYDVEGEAFVCSYLPVVGAMNENATLYLAPGSIIDPEKFLAEIERLDVDPEGIFIHPRAAVVEDRDILAEMAPSSATERLASTRKGAGAALARKVLREAVLAGEHPVLKRFSRAIDLQGYLDDGLTAVVEVPHGLGLSLNSGLAYPYLTSREITVSQALSDCQVHPHYLGQTLMTIRCHPIRVGNLIEDNEVKGVSGPFYPDCEELSWEDLRQTPELTTMTKRERRIASFSIQQYEDAVSLLRPDFVLLNFCNYLDEEKLAHLVEDLGEIRPVTHLGFGAKPSDVKTVADWDLGTGLLDPESEAFCFAHALAGAA